jgi:hypothetical protein
MSPERVRVASPSSVKQSTRTLVVAAQPNSVQ